MTGKWSLHAEPGARPSFLSEPRVVGAAAGHASVGIGWVLEFYRDPVPCLPSAGPTELLNPPVGAGWAASGGRARARRSGGAAGRETGGRGGCCLPWASATPGLPGTPVLLCSAGRGRLSLRSSLQAPMQKLPRLGTNASSRALLSPCVTPSLPEWPVAGGGRAAGTGTASGGGRAAGPGIESGGGCAAATGGADPRGFALTLPALPCRTDCVTNSLQRLS